MKRYDPQKPPDSREWLRLDEAELIELVLRHHRRAGVRLPNARSRATIHVVVENQVALGDEVPVRRTLLCDCSRKASTDTMPFTPSDPF